MTRFARAGRDLCLIAVGVLTLIDRPLSVAESGLGGPLGYVWATMIGGGAIVALLGLTLDRLQAEVWGCASVGCGFAVWAFTSIAQPEPTLVSYALACVFLSGTFGQLYRIGMITEGRVDRV